MPEERQEKEEGEREKYRKDHWLQEAKKRQKVGFWNSVIRTYATKWADKILLFPNCFQRWSTSGFLFGNKFFKKIRAFCTSYYFCLYKMEEAKWHCHSWYNLLLSFFFEELSFAWRVLFFYFCPWLYGVMHEAQKLRSAFLYPYRVLLSAVVFSLYDAWG